MDEKKVREAIYCMKESIGETMCEECVNYYKCGRTKMDDMKRTAIEALEKQLPKRPDIMDYILGDINFKCPTCKSEYICEKENEPLYCQNCGQRIDWSEEE